MTSPYWFKWHSFYLSIESHFVGVYGRYELHRKEDQKLWSPARQQIWPWERSKVKAMAWWHLKGLVTKIMHAKYQCSIIYTSEDMSQVKVFGTEGQTDRGMDRQRDGQTDEWDLMSPAFAKARGTIKCTALAVHENLLFFPMLFISPVNTDKMRFNTYIYSFLQQSLSRNCLL